MEKIKFKNRTWELAGHLHLPADFDPAKQYAGIVCTHPGSSVKEQTAGLYAAKLAEAGFVALAYDASFQGESGGEPRYIEDPATRVEDIKCAVDYLTTLPYITSIGALGICAGGGYTAHAALTEKRIKAVVTVVPANGGRAFGERDPLAALEKIGEQRTAEANGAAPLIVNWTPATAVGETDMDMLGAIDYYRTPRGEHPNANNQLRFYNMGAMMTFDAFHMAEKYFTQPLLVIVGDKVGTFGSYRDGFELFNKAAVKNKQIHVVAGAGHYDLYDQPWATGEALEKIVPFLRENL